MNSNRAGNSNSNSNSSNSNSSNSNLPGTMVKRDKVSAPVSSLGFIVYPRLQAPRLKMKGKIRTGLKNTRRSSRFLVF